MNLDLLISKYLDGELSIEEDISLREVIKSDPIARRTFDSYLDMQIEIQKDAQSIRLPKTLNKRTEEKILMDIMKATPIVIHRIEPVTQRRKYPRLAGLVAALLLFTVFSIYENKAPQFGNGFSEVSKANTSDMIEHNFSSNEKSNLPAKSNNKKISSKVMFSSTESKIDNVAKELTVINAVSEENLNIQSSENVTLQNSINSVDNSIQNNLNVSNEKPNAIENFENKIMQSKDNGNVQQLNQNANYNLPQVKSEFNSPQSFINESFYDKRDILLTSFYSRDFAHAGIKTSNNSPIITYSQSLGYSINDNSKIGLEFGVTEFASDRRSFLMVPVSSSNKNVGGKTEVLDPVASDGYILVPITVSDNQQIYWATLFFDYNLLNYKGLLLESRMGLGMSGNGFVGYGKFYAMYDLYSGIFFTIGAEGRLFETGIKTSGNESLGQSLGIIYGLQFKF